MSTTDNLVDLASARLGGVALSANDEFFAEKENLLKPAAPVFAPDKYTERGKWMDGWETRRRREPGHDWCIVRLGLPGIIRQVVVDTTFFRGNFPAECSLDAVALPHATPTAQLQTNDVWTEALAKQPLRGNAQNSFTSSSATRFTHVRLNIFPDGGVARLRVLGEVVPDWPQLLARGECIDLGAIENGGLAIACSDMFFSDRNNLLLPGPALNMGDGWETKRRRGPGHDWVIVRLGRRGTLQRLEVDTTHFKGNAPARCAVDVCDAPEATASALQREPGPWQPLLSEVALLPHTRHLFEHQLKGVGAATHARLCIYPDGGVARLRLYGRPAA